MDISSQEIASPLLLVVVAVGGGGSSGCGRLLLVPPGSSAEEACTAKCFHFAFSSTPSAQTPDWMAKNSARNSSGKGGCSNRGLEDCVAEVACISLRLHCTAWSFLLWVTLGKTATGSSLSNFLKRWFVFSAVMLCFAHLTSELLVESLTAPLKTRAFSSFIYMLHQPTQAWEKRFLPVEEHELPAIHLAHTDTGDWMVYTGKRLFPVIFCIPHELFKVRQWIARGTCI